jgi:hypothetical protein
MVFLLRSTKSFWGGGVCTLYYATHTTILLLVATAGLHGRPALHIIEIVLWFLRNSTGTACTIIHASEIPREELTSLTINISQ